VDSLPTAAVAARKRNLCLYLKQRPIDKRAFAVGILPAQDKLIPAQDKLIMDAKAADEGKARRARTIRTCEKR
jgi:hypothetical protein